MNRSAAIGIDLGVSNSCVAVMRSNDVYIIPNDMGNRITPSYVAFNNCDRLVGDAARDQLTLNPMNTIFDIKRLMGKRFDDPSIFTNTKDWPFIVKHINTEAHIEVNCENQLQTFAPEEIGAMILTKLKENAESYLNQTIENVVLTVPTNFKHAEFRAIIDAGRIAGLNVLRIITESMAAAIAYTYFNRGWQRDVNLLIFDLGASALYVTIMKAGINHVINVIASSGDTQLGGINCDKHLMEFCIREFQREHQRDLRGNETALRRLQLACERAKKELSVVMSSLIFVSDIVDGIDLNITMTRPCFDTLNMNLFSECLQLIRRILANAHMNKTEIHKIILVGGSVRIPMLQELISNFFDGRPLEMQINPDEVIAYGAAVYAKLFEQHQSPIHKTIDSTIFNQTLMALGTGIGHDGSKMMVIIPKHTSFPFTVSYTATTSVDYQDKIQFEIREGDSQNAVENTILGEFTLFEINRAPARVACIDVIWTIDQNGILVVTACDQATNYSSGVRITNTSFCLRKERIDRMIQNAENYRRENEKFKSNIVSKNLLENECCELIRKLSEEFDGIVPSIILTGLEKINDILVWIQNNPNVHVDEYECRREMVKVFAQRMYEKLRNC